MKQHFLMEGVELVAVGEASLREALKRVIACAACSESASRSFQWLLGQVLGNAGMTEYLLSCSAQCPNCDAEILENTRIDFDGKAKAALEEFTYFDVRDEGQDVVFIDEPTLLQAQDFICGCEHCSDRAEIPFDQLLDAITGSDPATTEYVICHAAKCGLCRHDVMEKTLVVPR